MRKIILPFLFLTLVLSLDAQVFLDEDFSTGTGVTPPTGWFSLDNTGGGGTTAAELWSFDNPGGRALNAPITNPAAIFDSDGASSGGGAEDASLVSPAMDLTGTTNLVLSFDHFFQTGYGGAYNVEVFDGSTWISVLSGGAASTADPASESIDVSAQLAGVSNAQVRFTWTGNWSWFWIVDNVKLEQPTTCTITGITDTGNFSNCNSAGGTYDRDIVISYANAPGLALLSVTTSAGAQSFAATGSPQTVTITGLPLDGAAEDVTASFSATCTSTVAGAFTNIGGCPPANNVICGATPVACGASETFDTGTDFFLEDATDLPDAVGCGSGGLRSPNAFFVFTGTGDDVTASLCNSGFDTRIDVYCLTGGTCGASPVFTCVGGNDDAACGGFRSEVTFPTAAGTDYYIMCHAFGTGSTGAFQLDITCAAACTPPANADCTNAISGCGFVGTAADLGVITSAACTPTSGDNSCSSSNPINPSCADSGFQTSIDTWYSFTTGASTLAIEATLTAGTATDPRFVIYDMCGGIELFCSGAVTGPIQITGTAANTTYYLQVFTASGNEGTYDICVRETCAPVAFNTPTIDLTSCPTGPTLSMNITDLGSATSVTISNDVGVAATTVTAAGDVSLGVFPPGMNVIFTVSSDIADTDCGDQTAGPFIINCPPANDDVANAINLTVDAGCSGDAYTNLYATAETDAGTNAEPVGSCFGSTTATNSVWFTFTAPANADYYVSTDFVGDGTNDLHDTHLAVFSATDPTDFTTYTEEACDEDGGVSAPNGFTSFATVTATAGTTYYILVDGYGADAGDFCIEVTSTVCGANAVVLPPASTATSITCVTNCEIGGWTYYEDPGNPGDYLFAINWAPDGSLSAANTTAKGAATVTIDVLAAATYVEGGVANTSGEATWGMARYWNVDNAGAFDEAVNIKFFYDPQEATDINNAMTGDARPDEGFLWFKTISGPYSPALVTAPAVTGVLALPVAGAGTENGITYVQFDGLTSFSGGTAATGVGPQDNPLPVEFAAFTGYAADKVNVLEWTTASEQNNSHFNIERSLDGVNFEKIGMVSGAGNSSEVLSYSFEDTNPAVLAYYRVMQVDFDGGYDYSNVIKIRRNAKGLSFGTISPNPTKGMTSIVLNTVNAGSFRMQVVSVDGKIMSSQTIELVEGLNTQEIDLSSFSNGVYMLSVSNGADRIITRVVKAE